MAVRAFQPLAFRAADNERAPSRARALHRNRYFLPLAAPRRAAFPRPPPPVSTGGRSRMPPTQPGTSWDVDRPLSRHRWSLMFLVTSLALSVREYHAVSADESFNNENSAIPESFLFKSRHFGMSLSISNDINNIYIINFV